jgi:hypothetical protein
VLRWTSADTILPDVFSSQQLNRYTYALNNPLSFVDPSGHGIVLPEDAGTPSYGGGGGPPPDPLVIPPLPDDFQPPPPGPPSEPVQSCGDCWVSGADRIDSFGNGLIVPGIQRLRSPWWRNFKTATRWRHAMRYNLFPGAGSVGYAIDGYQYGSLLASHTDALLQGGMSGSAYELNALATIAAAGFDMGIDYVGAKAAPATGGWSLGLILAKESFALAEGRQIPGLGWTIGNPATAFGQLTAIVVGSLSNPEIGAVTMDVLFGGSGGPVHGPPAVVYTGAPPVAAPVAAPPATPVPMSTPSPPAQSMP